MADSQDADRLADLDRRLKASRVGIAVRRAVQISRGPRPARTRPPSSKLSCRAR